MLREITQIQQDQQATKNTIQEPKSELGDTDRNINSSSGSDDNIKNISREQDQK